MKIFCLFIILTSSLTALAQDHSLRADDFEKAILADSIQLLDVRTAGEYKSGRIRNSLHADWNQPGQFRERVQYIDKHRPVYVYCLVGGRSAAAAQWMRSQGFTKVVELEGGINAWKRSGKPLEGQSNEKQMSLEEYQASLPKNGMVLVDFGASWCPPCVKMEPVLEEIRKDSSLSFQFVRIDAGVHTNLMKSLGIEPIPQFIIYKNGKETWRKQGIVTREEFVSQLK